MEELKETNPKLTSQKKREANKYIEYIFKNTGIKFRCRNIREYIFLKTLYLLLLEYDDIEDQFYVPVANHYYKYSKLKDRDYFGYDLGEILKQYIVKYYYQDLTNFAVIWEYYNWLVEEEFDERLMIAFNTLEKRIDKNEEKILRLLDNIGTQMVDDSVILQALETDEPFMVRWHTQHDISVCKDCYWRDNKLYYWEELPKKHPNCRCWFSIIYK